MQLWHTWVIVAIVFFIAEIFTSGFFAATIGLGFLGMAVAAWLSLGFTAQLIVFSITSLFVFFALRPLFHRYFSTRTAPRTNLDALMGSPAIVTETSKTRVTVRVGREEWPAEGECLDDLEVGDRVNIVSVVGNRVLIEPAGKRGDKNDGS